MSVEQDKHFIKSVESKNIRMSRASIQGLISKDRRLVDFETPEFVKYANDNLDEFWVEDDGETEFPSKEKWDNDLWKLMCVELEYNFSKKKFDFIIEIMDHLRKIGHPDFQVKTKSTSQTKISAEDSIDEVKSNKGNKNTIVSAAVGGAIGLIGGAIIGKTTVGALVGVAVGAAIGYTKDKN